jgi:signal transduction histidine kinase
VRGGLTNRMIAGSGVLMLIVGAAVSALLILLIGEQRETARLSARSQEVLVTVDEVQQLILDLDRGARGYIITGDPATLKAWTAAAATFPDRSATLQRLVDTPGQQSRARRITQDGQSYIRDYAIPVMKAAQRGDPSVHSTATMQEGRRRITDLEAQVDSLQATEHDLAAEREKRAQETGQAVIAGAAGMAGSILLSVLVIGYLTRVVVRPVRRAAAMAGRLAGGDLSTRIPETGGGEIGQLVRSLNIMGDSLQQLVETQTALRRVAMLVARGASQTEVLDAIAEELGRLIGTDGAHIVRYEPDGTATVVAAWGASNIQMPVGRNLSLEGRSVTATVLNTGQAARMDSYAGAPGAIAAQLHEHGARAAVGAPIYVEGRLWGVVTATMTRDEPLAPDAEARLADYTDLIATTVANAQARADLAASRARVVVAADQTRRRIERNLHDGIEQQLVSLALQVRQAQTSIPSQISEPHQRLSEVTNGLTGVLEDLREISRGIHPPLLTASGLRPALKALARRSAVPVDLDVRLEGRLPEPVEAAAYYIVTEALANVAKHAHASFVRVEAALRHGRLHLSVVDDGVGGADPARGSGLIGLVDRVEALGGTIMISSPAGHGTSLQVELPLEL